MSLPTVGAKAPVFKLKDQSGQEHHLETYRGSWVLLYFYPEDDTPGCTIEACGFRDLQSELAKHKCIVLGVSPDNVESHERFSNKFTLNFPILADEKKGVANLYGVWGEKQFMGKKYMGVSRTSFLIDPSGEIAKVYEHVKPETHPQEVITDIQERTP